MRLSILPWLGLLGCQPAPIVHEPIVAACAPNRVHDVVIEGAPRSAVAPLAVLEGTLDDPPRTERVTASATDALRTAGYARATLAVTRSLQCGIELRVAVALGPRFRIARIDFETTDAFPIGERFAAIEDALGTINVVGGVYVEDRLIRALDDLRRRYHDAGWLDATIAAPRARYDDHGEVSIAIPITPGERFRIGNVTATGGNRTARVAALEAIGLRGGEWYDGATIRTGLERASRELDRKIELRTDIVKARAVIDVVAVVEPAR